MLKTICLCSIVAFPYIATATPFDSSYDGKEDSTYYSTVTDQQKNKNKAKAPKYTYRFRAAGKDTSGNTCGRLIITKDDTDTTVGEFDYRSKLGKATCDKIGETFILELRNRKNGQNATWTITYQGNNLDLSANNGKFKDTVTRNLSKTHISTDTDIAEICGTQEGDHAFLPPAIQASDTLELKHPFNSVGCEWLVSYDDEKNGVRNTIDYSSVGKTKSGNIYGVALLQVSNGKRVIYENMMEYEVVGKSRSGYVLDFGQDHPVSLKVVDDSTVIMGGGNVAKVVARQFYTPEQIDKLRSLTSFHKLGK